MRHAWIVLLAAVLVGQAGCRKPDVMRQEANRVAIVARIQPVKYVRTGGASGPGDTITIAQDGTIQTSGRLVGNATAKLSEFQLMQVARVFDGWEKLKDSYPAPDGAREPFTLSITYGAKTVTVSDGAKGVPDQFALAQDKLESIARDLPASRK